MDATIESVLLEIRQAQRLEDSAEALKAIAGSLDSLTPEDRAKLLNMPSMSKLLDDAEKKAQDATRPGTAICNDEGRVIANVPWTYEEFVKQFGEVEWTPMEHRWVSFNGVQIEVQKGAPIKTPPQFRDTAMEAWHKEQNLTAEGAAIMSRNFGKDSMILTGDGTEIWRGGR